MSVRTNAATTPRKIGPTRTGAARRAWLLRRAGAMEAANWRSIGRWIARRPRVPRGASAHRYDAPTRTILIVFVVLSAVEVPIVDLLTHPWPWLRWPLMVLGVWGVATMLGMLLGDITRPHAVGPEGIRVRQGGEVDIDLPWDVVHGVRRRRAAVADARGLLISGEGDEMTLHQVVQDFTEIDITLERPTLIHLPQGDVTVSMLSIAVDAPQAFLDAVRTHIP